MIMKRAAVNAARFAFVERQTRVIACDANLRVPTSGASHGCWIWLLFWVPVFGAYD